MEIPSIGSQLQPQQLQNQTIKGGKPQPPTAKSQVNTPVDADGDHDGDISPMDKGGNVDTTA